MIPKSPGRTSAIPHPSSPKTKPTPVSTRATGRPLKSPTPSVTNMNRGYSSARGRLSRTGARLVGDADRGQGAALVRAWCRRNVGPGEEEGVPDDDRHTRQQEQQEPERHG